MRKRISIQISVALSITLLAVLTATASAQVPSTGERPATSFSFGEAKAHAHQASATLVGAYAGRTLINDETNTVGNLFIGNVVGVKTSAGVVWLWYDWNLWDDLQKASMWASRPTTVRVTYDPVCLMARSVEEVRSPPKPKSKVPAISAAARAATAPAPRTLLRAFRLWLFGPD
jgi:hypothetical protein